MKVITIVLTAVILATPAYAKDKVVSLGLGHYQCNGGSAECKAFNAEQRQYQHDKQMREWRMREEREENRKIVRELEKANDWENDNY